MTLRGDDDDTSSGRITQGGRPDAGQPGPARRSGMSFWWFAVALLVGVVLVVGWLSTVSRKSAPAEANTVTLSGGMTSEAGRPAGTAAPAR